MKTWLLLDTETGDVYSKNLLDVRPGEGIWVEIGEQEIFCIAFSNARNLVNFTLHEIVFVDIGEEESCY